MIAPEAIASDSEAPTRHEASSVIAQSVRILHSPLPKGKAIGMWQVDKAAEDRRPITPCLAKAETHKQGYAALIRKSLEARLAISPPPPSSQRQDATSAARDHRLGSEKVRRICHIGDLGEAKGVIGGVGGK